MRSRLVVSRIPDVDGFFHKSFEGRSWSRKSNTEMGESFGPIQNLSISKTSSKRKRHRDERGSQKKPRPNSQKFKLSQQYETAQKPGESAVSLYESGNDNFNNRVLGCLTIASTGRALSEFNQRLQFTKSVSSSIRELLITSKCDQSASLSA